MRHRRKFQRLDEKSKKEQREEQKKQEQESINNFKKIIIKSSHIDSKKEKFTIFKDGLPKFLNETTFETNKIHIIRGNNGQGKSTLLKSIVNATFLNTLDSFSERLKISSTNKDIANLLNYHMPYSPYKRDDNSMFPSGIKYNLTDLKNSITIYTDFSVSYFREQSGDVFSDISEEYNQNSNGERKIKGINNLLNHLKIILNIEDKDLDKGLNLIVVMDEPESGLSMEIQEEFEKKIRRYLNKAIKKEKISLTFIISSHSFVWSKSKQVNIHNINSFKTDIERKKEHKKVFI